MKEIITNYDTNEKKKVGSKIREDNNRVKLPYWLGSLDKIKAEEVNKLENWKKKNSEDEYIIENKLDGISCLLFYDNEKVKLYTRGDGIIGADITHLLEYIKNIPLLKNKISIRGELIMQDKIFKEKYSKDNSNGRNMVSGLVNAKSLRDGIEDVEFIAYEIILDEEKQSKPFTQLELLKKYGFTVVNNIIIKNDELSIDNLSEILIENKSKSIYDIDGIIIQPNKEYVRNKKDNPKYAVAFKMTISDNLIEAEVDDVEWNISKHKLLKPRIKIKPVNLNGITITYASGFNAKYIVEKSIGKGSIIEITRSGDVIPFIVSVIKPSKEPDMPKVSYKWNENNVDIIVEEDEENIAEIKMISSFFSSMGIKNISDATVEKIYKSGYDTGHIANDGDMSWDPIVERESFILSNMVPQLPSLNRGIWKLLETGVRVWAWQTGHTFTVYAGSIYDSSIDQSVGPNRVVVPHAFYKIVIDNTTKKSMAWIFPHKENLGTDLTAYQVTISDVEKSTGIQFSVPDDKSSHNQMLPISIAQFTKAKAAQCH